MASYLLDAAMLERDLKELIIEKTEGVPFFIEEFITSCRNLKVIEKKDNQYILSNNNGRVTLPSTIQGVIMARVDALSAATKEVLQIGSVIEREFGYELVKRVSGLSEEELLFHLGVIKRVELVHERGQFPKCTFIFRHALTRDVIYDSILNSNKKRLHEKIGNAIEALYKDNIVEYYGALANHYVSSENHVKGAEYSKLSATRSERASAINDAIEYTRKRVVSLERLSMTDEVLKEVIDARTVLGGYLLRILNYLEAKEAIDPIIDLAVKSGYKKRLPEILTINGTFQMNINEDIAKAFQNLEKAVNISDELNDNVAMSLSNWRLGLTLALNCDFKRTIRHLKKALHYMTSMENLWGMSATNSYLSIWGYGFSGNIDLAGQSSDEAVRIAEESGDIYSKSMAYTSRGFYYYLKGFLDEAAKQLSKALSLSEKIDYSIFEAMARLFLGELSYDMGEYQNSKDHHGKTLSLLRRYNIYQSWIGLHEFGVAKAQVRMSNQQLDSKPFHSNVSENKVKIYQGWKQRHMAEILYHMDNAHKLEAEHWIRQAIASDRHNGMNWYVARDYKLLADFLKHKGDHSKAKENLQKSVSLFEECGAHRWTEKFNRELSRLYGQTRSV